MPGYSGHYPPIQQNYPNQIMMQQNYPNPVTFTFNPNHSVLPQHNCWQCPPTMGTLNQLQQMNAIDMLALQGQLNEPYRCRFHLDNQTSTSDLSKENGEFLGKVLKTWRWFLVLRPDLNNLAGILKSKWPYWLQAPTNRNVCLLSFVILSFHKLFC